MSRHKQSQRLVNVNKNDHLFLHRQQFSLFNRRLNIKHSLIVSACDSCELINEPRFWSILNVWFLI